MSFVFRWLYSLGGGATIQNNLLHEGEEKEKLRGSLSDLVPFSDPIKIL